MKNGSEKVVEEKVTWRGWISLFILIILFSGIFQKAGTPWAALDFSNLCGKFGAIAEGVNFQGKGGLGAREGFLFTLTLIPTVCLAVGLIDVVEHMGAMKAAARLFNPLLRPLLGIPGITGIAFVSSFTSSDIGAVMTKQLYEDGLITDDERTVFVAYQYAGSAVILNTINTQAPLLPFALLALGPIIVIEVFCKILGANVVRLILKLGNKKKSANQEVS
jgi:nucleoside recognition membrane protein YjiH